MVMGIVVKDVDDVLEAIDRTADREQRFFTVKGYDGNFDICTYEFMRGYYGLQDDEEPGQYYISYLSYNCGYDIIKIICKPLSNQFELKYFKKRRRKIEENDEKVKNEITALFMNWCISTEETP